MSAPTPHSGPVGPDTLITVKVLIDNQNRRFKLALRDLGAHILPQKLRFLLQIPADNEVRFDRFSDSAGTYVTLDSDNPAIYKQLYRAAKAKLKLRLRATIIEAKKPESTLVAEDKTPAEPNKRNTYLDTVLLNQPTEAYTFKPLQPISESSDANKSISETSIRTAELSRPTLPTLNDFGSTTFTIDCNYCGQSVKNEHYHCGKCENGDFDLCFTCIEQGITCDNDDHWLVKRTLKDGKITASKTETLAPKNKPQPSTRAPERSQIADEDQRTCNSCIIQLDASCFVTCQQCPDFDLCFFCLEHGEHGHHPAHTFTPVDVSASVVSPYIQTLCEQGRGLRHEAVCDGCDATIVGVRHKCLTCPDFDYCSKCIQGAAEAHSGHRFAPIYEQLNMLGIRKEHHRGIYCDGPICSARARKSYIRGDRYKCTICVDTDFCANCEALPGNLHNKTHPLIKLKTPVRHLAIDTINELGNGSTETFQTEKPKARNAATETVRSTSINAATQVQTVAEVTPVEAAKQEVVELKPNASPVGLQAWFESDSTPDGTSFGPDRLVSQSWTLRNPGPQAWPAGCAVYFIGGDDMRNLDDKHPSSVASMTLANRSNVLEQSVEPGQTAVFTVLLKSPNREGRAISYWRLKTADYLPFGHKLWVDITVSNKTVKPVEIPAIIPVEAPVQTIEKAVEKETKSQDSSTMIFPKLEKESPESSISNIKQEPVQVAPSVASEEHDLLDDLESMALEDESTQDGFMTDEEYDILDAEDEDEEFYTAQPPARK